MSAPETRGTALLIRITSLRIALVPAVMGLILLGPRSRYAWTAAAVVFAAAALTDFLDEWVMLVAAFVTVMSAVEYIARFSSVLRPSRP